MPDKNEIERRKQIKRELREKARLEFEQSLPISRVDFQNLFDFLDEKLSNQECDDNLAFTYDFFLKNEFKNIEEIENWLKNNGGYCDCEVLYNVEEMFDQDSIL